MTSTPATDAPIGTLIAAALADDVPTFLKTLRGLMESVGLVHLVTQLCILVNTLGRDAHGDDWESVVSTTLHFLDIATAEQQNGEGR